MAVPAGQLKGVFVCLSVCLFVCLCMSGMHDDLIQRLFSWSVQRCVCVLYVVCLSVCLFVREWYAWFDPEIIQLVSSKLCVLYVACLCVHGRCA